jgi:hypothetical protein
MTKQSGFTKKEKMIMKKKLFKAGIFSFLVSFFLLFIIMILNSETISTGKSGAELLDKINYNYYWPTALGYSLIISVIVVIIIYIIKKLRD